MSTTSTALTVIDRKTGEVLDLAQADTERLARFVTELDDLHTELADAGRLVSRELVDRLDRRRDWTLRVGDPADGRQYEITAPSPAAGSDVYDAGPLEEELRKLVGRNTIDETAAAAALQRKLVITVAVPLVGDIEAMAREIRDADDAKIGGVKVEIAKVDVVQKAMIGGIKKLQKAPGAGAALKRVRRHVPVSDRQATVKIKTKAS